MVLEEWVRRKKSPFLKIAPSISHPQGEEKPETKVVAFYRGALGRGYGSSPAMCSQSAPHSPSPESDFVSSSSLSSAGQMYVYNLHPHAERLFE